MFCDIIKRLMGERKKMDNFENQEIHRSRVERKKQEELERQKILEEIEAHQREREEKRNSKYAINRKIKSNKPSRKSKAEANAILKAKKEEERKALEEAKKNAAIAPVIEDNFDSQDNNSPDNDNKPKKNIKHKKLIFLLKVALCICLVFAIAGCTYVGIVVAKAPEIETDNIYSLLSQSSVLYDDSENVIDNVFSDKKRTIVEIQDIPDEVKWAFICLEDKTFYKHHGFNIVRIFGAIKDAIFSSNHNISGTSTITQQLARNLYLEEQMSTRSITRKVQEAYYSVILEKKLSKDEILEAYLNTVNFGCGYGIQTAAQSYFSKDVDELTLPEAAALAALPQAPSAYALVKAVDLDSVTEENEDILYTDGSYAYLSNDKAEPRMRTCMKLMLDQEKISQDDYDLYKDTKIKDMVNPSSEQVNTMSNYFADYVISQVIQDLMTQYGYDKARATDLVYNGGLQIHTTMDSQAQSVLEKEFNKDSNFPVPTSYSKDKNGNILNKDRNAVLLYKYSNYIEDDGTFKLQPSEYSKNGDGSLVLYKGKRLNFYDTTVNDTTDYSIEFKNMYLIEKDKFYSISGGYLSIPQSYKSKDANGDIVISAQFFTDYPSFFTEEGKVLSTKNYTLRAKVIQPQAAMTIIDNSNGAIKAMIGGRKIEGRLLYNRATSPRQPGSSIKPIAVYSAALQKSYELAKDKALYPLTDTGFDAQGTRFWGNYITAGSIVRDEKMTVNGQVWPKNSYKGYKGIYTFRTALQQSVNVCAVKILAQVGVDYSFEHAQKFGLTTLVGSGASNDVNLAALGMGGLTTGVSTLEMASAYTTFVNEGVHKSYYCYDKVTTRSGGLLLEPNHTETEVLDKGVAWIMRDILQTVVSEGIGSPARVSGQKVGGKTGTTSDKFDIWFDGFTANYTASLWIGNDVNIQLSSMSNKAAALWSKCMGQINRAKGGKYSSKPKNVVSAKIDTQTGQLASENSKKTRTEYFTKGTQPTTYFNPLDWIEGEDGLLYDEEGNLVEDPTLKATETDVKEPSEDNPEKQENSDIVPTPEDEIETDPQAQPEESDSAA